MPEPNWDEEHARYVAAVRRFLGRRWKGDRGITVPAAQYLHDYVTREKPRCVLELGTGFSTIALRHAAALTDTRIFSADHDPHWLAFVRGFLSAREDVTHDDFSTIPRVKRIVAAKRIRYDCIFIDQGPSGAARIRDLSWCRSILAKGGVFILDDWYPEGTPIHSSYTRKAKRALTGLRMSHALISGTEVGVRKGLCLARC